LVEYRRKARRRGGSKPVLAQEPAHQISCAVRRAQAKGRERLPIERQPEIDIGLQGLRASRRARSSWRRAASA
jgi:hypothetical protein